MTEEKEEKKTKKSESTGSRTVAKRGFLIVQNEYRCAILAGDCLEDLGVPKRFFQNLETEGVI